VLSLLHVFFLTTRQVKPFEALHSLARKSDSLQKGNVSKSVCFPSFFRNVIYSTLVSVNLESSLLTHHVNNFIKQFYFTYQKNPK
jgi:hypothetical protein